VLQFFSWASAWALPACVRLLGCLGSSCAPFDCSVTASVVVGIEQGREKKIAQSQAGGPRRDTESLRPKPAPLAGPVAPPPASKALHPKAETAQAVEPCQKLGLDYPTKWGRSPGIRVVRNLIHSDVPRPVHRAIFSTLEVRGLEKDSRRRNHSSFVANHTSNMDTPLVIAAFAGRDSVGAWWSPRQWTNFFMDFTPSPSNRVGVQTPSRLTGHKSEIAVAHRFAFRSGAGGLESPESIPKAARTPRRRTPRVQGRWPRISPKTLHEGPSSRCTSTNRAGSRVQVRQGPPNSVSAARPAPPIHVVVVFGDAMPRRRG